MNPTHLNRITPITDFLRDHYPELATTKFLKTFAIWSSAFPCSQLHYQAITDAWNLASDAGVSIEVLRRPSHQIALKLCPIDPLAPHPGNRLPTSQIRRHFTSQTPQHSKIASHGHNPKSLG